MKYLQKLGKSLMLPVSVLPICGLLMGLGYFLCPAVMQGGAMEGVTGQIGYFLVKAGGALIDNMALLFAIGVGVGMSEKNDGTGAVASLVAWLTITTLLGTDAVTTLIPAITEDADKVLAFSKIANPFIGILSGVIGSTCFNRFKNTKLPDWLSFFSGKRCVAIFSGIVSIIVSFILLFVWPAIFSGLTTLGESIASIGAAGAGIYAFLNRLLIPVGLHHALNNVFWFDTTGLGDLTHFWAGETSADVSWSLGMYMSGFFPCMMFGIPGAVLAIIRNATPERRKTVTGIMLSCAVCSFVCGVTEPFEFAFMFISPMLYVVYAIMYGLITYITVISGFRAGFCFSGGVLDLVFSSSLPAAARTWLIIPLGILSFVIFYAVFSFMIKKFNLKTPGREEEEAAGSAESGSGSSPVGNSYSDKAARILEGIGGKRNIISIDNCITRLRLELKDVSKIDEKKVLSAGAAGVINTGKNTVQIVIGTTVQFVADEMHRLCESGDHKMITHQDSIFGEPECNITGNCFEYVVKDPTGIHARPAGIIAGIVGKYDSKITVSANGKEAPADKIIDLMSLGITGGTKIKVSADGTDAGQALTELYQYMRKTL